MNSHAEVIAAFGGLKALADAIQVKPETAIHWPKRGIPARYWPRVERAALERDIPVTTHDLERLMEVESACQPAE